MFHTAYSINSDTVAPHPRILGLTQALEATLSASLSQTIFHTSLPLDSRFSVIRSRECNVGNFVADVVRCMMNSDAAILVGGTFRSDRGFLTFKG